LSWALSAYCPGAKRRWHALIGEAGNSQYRTKLGSILRAMALYTFPLVIYRECTQHTTTCTPLVGKTENSVGVEKMYKVYNGVDFRRRCTPSLTRRLLLAKPETNSPM
jgi:hypothetical protein